MRKIKDRIILHFLQKEYIVNAIEAKANLDAFKEKPSKKIILGLFLIILSYILGWPAVTFSGIMALYFQEPLITAIGGPATYAFSYLVFFAGVNLAGKEYVIIFSKWFARKIFEKKYYELNDAKTEQ